MVKEINNSDDRKKLLDTYMFIIEKDYKGMNLSCNQVLTILRETFGVDFTFEELIDYTDRILDMDIKDLEQQVSNLGIRYE